MFLAWPGALRDNTLTADAFADIMYCHKGYLVGFWNKWCCNYHKVLATDCRNLIVDGARVVGLRVLLMKQVN